MKRTAWITLLLVFISLLFLFWYKRIHSVKTTSTQDVTSLALDRKLLIATQTSFFKDSLTANVLEHYKSTKVIIELIDVKALESKDVADFDAILIIHRWEARAPCKDVQSFMNNHYELKNKIVLLTTSWNGLEKMKDVDAITGASIVKDVPAFTEKVIEKLDQLLK